MSDPRAHVRWVRLLQSAVCVLLLCLLILLAGNYLSSYQQPYQFRVHGPLELTLDRGEIWLTRYTSVSACVEDDDELSPRSSSQNAITDSDRRWMGFALAQGTLGNGVGFYAFAVPHWLPLLLTSGGFMLLLRHLRKPVRG